ncbi:hypothetical protein B0T16DRAFT_330947 [Cercophora newfieldiana]|uniref:DUF7719 domain-containing protein n=1 Tax=Cercophora newfieldiana TaxID=92897 RepID=A0AA39Y8J3_9PEZI|nr:hypothetical protein B0T16DRAFT_330947 [Cercophora newfieldiana]
MARRRKEASTPDIKLRQPDRTGPTQETLLDIAQQRNLFAQAKEKEDANRRAAGQAVRPSDEDDDDEGPVLSPTAERIMETLLWTVSLTMLHFTLDVLVQHQFSINRVQWPKVWTRAAQAWMVFALLFYPLHPHSSNPTLVPGLPQRFQHGLRQAIFFATSVAAGCYLIYVTNSFGYLAVMKQAPPLGCLWVWSVIELDLPWAVLSLTGAGYFLWSRGYSIR